MSNTKPAYTVAQFCDAYGMCRTTCYEEINSGRLPSYQLGRRRYISAHAAAEWQKRLEVETAAKASGADLSEMLNDPIILI